MSFFLSKDPPAGAAESLKKRQKRFRFSGAPFLTDFQRVDGFRSFLPISPDARIRIALRAPGFTGKKHRPIPDAFPRE
jgi:hypothetical protein